MNRFTKVTAALGTAAILSLAAPLAASAHVTIDPGQAAPGSYTLITVKVPNESQTATTNRVEITLPSDTPFASVRYVPVAGWSTELVTTTLPSPVTVGEGEITEAVTAVVWTAERGAEIGGGELALFPLSVGPVPDVGSISLPTDQGYSDGSTVSWSDEGDEAEHPAPVLFVTDAPDAGHHGDASVAIDDPAAAPDVLARLLGIAGLVVGVVGLVVGITARRRPTS